ncbi:mandelate racemase/muconate lactonizing enzyme family protein [Roseibium marinum]|uniref:L-alanine-DL-glutamate epimerase-like enolase superfamily enzyme n=1 Tax=Roseibium marinum TaxID=281252 RepID=A0A2S3UK43_9HYPH|nr:mandelate racemase/muconate lactonizing enzyme family protein [Roseibium marinum]POF27950.1 L-alanine-DL-glutamate epimerase-like enolase superfamily enzyme [Roseibium marinum]
MKIEAWSAAAVRHSNLDPHWHYAGRDVPELPGLRLAFRSGQVVGEGYAPFLPHLDATPEALQSAGRSIAGALLGADLADLDGCLERLGPFARTRNAARSAAEMAMLDLAARSADISVAQLLGGTPRPLEVLRIIPVKPPDRMAEIAGSLVAKGYRALKLKATGKLEEDVARIAAVRAAAGPDVTLTVDANQAYDADGASRLETALRPYAIWSLEQPVSARDRSALARVRKTSKARIEADEGLFDREDLETLLAAVGADGISLKLARSGGLLASRDMALRAAGQNVYARLGTAFGGPLVTLATATLAGLCPVTGPAECAEFTHFDDQEHVWPLIRDGFLIAPEGSGFGQERVVPWTAPWNG